jgi:hypothetical protein
MKTLKAILAGCVLAGAVALSSAAQAQTLQVLTAGSSAQFGPFAVAAYQLAKAGGATAYHYTVKSGTCVSGSTTCYAGLVDSRSSNIPVEPANLWVVWSTNGIWAYASVDSTVGVRSFLAYPRVKMQLAATLPLSATSNYSYWADGTNDTALTTAVKTALNNHALTAANTDIRPEDALFATNRSLNTLGYGKIADTRSGHSGQYLIGNSIVSYFTGSTATPTSFSLTASSGSTVVDDPISGQQIPSSAAFVTIPIGAAPIVFLANNSTGSATASATNITSANAASLFSGHGNCTGSLVTGVASTAALTAILREPLSGTMNTTEYSVFVPGGYSQETGITGGAPGSANNPLHIACGSGFRDRAVGTGDEVKAVENGYGTPATTNAMGYAFFSYESTGANAALKYITLNSIDPINASYTTGALPTCTITGGAYNCPVTPGTSFKNLRNGTYKAWSVYRLITDSTGQAAAKTLVNEAQTLVNSNIPDFVPFNPICRLTPTGIDEPGLAVYREHYVPSTITTIPNTITLTANDGPRFLFGTTSTTVSCTLGGAHTLQHLTLGGTDASGANTEAGGDVGGTIQGPFTSAAPPAVPGVTQTTTH